MEEADLAKCGRVSAKACIHSNGEVFRPKDIFDQCLIRTDIETQANCLWVKRLVKKSATKEIEKRS